MDGQRLRGSLGRVTQSVDHRSELPQYRADSRHGRVTRVDQPRRITHIPGTVTYLHQIQRPVAVDHGEPWTSFRCGESVIQGPTSLSTSTSSTWKERADAARVAA
jgi:hypothetical protein